MNESDRKIFLNGFAYLCEVFEKKTSSGLLDAYFKALEKFDISDVEKAISAAISTCKWFPKPFELIELITGGSESIEDLAVLEAGKVIEAIKRVGKYKSVCFDDAVTMAVIKTGFGGWVKMCSDLNEVEEKWFRKDFEAIYGAYNRQGIKHTGNLIGLSETTNDSNNKKNKEGVILIGDQEKAKQISASSAINKNVLRLTENIG